MATFDTWFYISAAGFLASLFLWPYLFIQYRRSSHADGEEESPSGLEPLVPINAPSPVIAASKTSPEVQKLVPVQATIPAKQIVQPVSGVQKASPTQTQPPAAAHPAPRPTIIPSGSTVPPGSGVQKIVPAAQTPSSAATPAPAPQVSKTLTDLKTGQTLAGGISPAVVYLQGVKAQLDRLDKEVKIVRDQMSHITQSQEVQFGTILRRLDELKGDLRTPAAVKTESAPASQKQSSGPIPIVENPSSKPQLSVASVEPTEPAPSQASEPESPQSKRKGPVWPV